MKTLVHIWRGQPVKKMLLFAALFLIVGFGFNSCVKSPVFINIESVKVNSLKDSVLQTTINFRVFNPNNISSTLTSSKIKTYYKQKLVGESVIENPQELPAKDTIVIAMRSDINLWRIVRAFPELVRSDSASFSIEGDNRVKAFGFNWNIPIKEKVTINVKKTVAQQVTKTFLLDSNFRVKQIKLSKAPGIGQTNFSMVIGLKNSFPFDYKILQLNLNIYRKHGTNPIANWKLIDTIQQKKGAVTDIPIAVAVNNFNLLSELRLSDLIHPNMEFTTKGSAEIAIQGRVFTIPIEVTKKVNANALTELNL